MILGEDNAQFHDFLYLLFLLSLNEHFHRKCSNKELHLIIQTVNDKDHVRVQESEEFIKILSSSLSQSIIYAFNSKTKLLKNT